MLLTVNVIYIPAALVTDADQKKSDHLTAEY